LANEVPGVSIPQEILERMRVAQKHGPDAAREEGVAICLEMYEAIRDNVDGVQVNFPRGGRRSVLDLIEAVRADQPRAGHGNDP
jgi:homocysteine S-methyltransferase